MPFGSVDQFAVVDVEEPVLADARAFLDGALHALAKVLADLARPARAGPRSPAAGGKIVDTRLVYDGTTFAGSRCVITNRISG